MPELQASAAAQLDADSMDSLPEEEDAKLHGLDGALSARAIDRPSHGRVVDEGGIAQLAPRASLKLSSAQIDQLGSLFKLLSDKTRLAILQILCDGEMNVSTLCRQLSLPQPTVSHHLGLLRMSRLIANRRNGKEVFYRLHERIAAPSWEDTDAGSRLQGASVKAVGLQIMDSGFSVQVTTGA